MKKIMLLSMLLMLFAFNAYGQTCTPTHQTVTDNILIFESHSSLQTYCILVMDSQRRGIPAGEGSPASIYAVQECNGGRAMSIAGKVYYVCVLERLPLSGTNQQACRFKLPQDTKSWWTLCSFLYQR